MTIQWTPDLEVGVEEIDGHHKELFRTLDQLVEAMRQGKGRSELATVLDFLESYVAAHFALEQQWMTETRYSKLEAHKAEHVSLAEGVKHLREQLTSTGASTALVIETCTRLSDWLRTHIGKTDREMAIYISTRRKARR